MVGTVAAWKVGVPVSHPWISDDQRYLRKTRDSTAATSTVRPATSPAQRSGSKPPLRRHSQLHDPAGPGHLPVPGTNYRSQPPHARSMKIESNYRVFFADIAGRHRI